MSAITSAIGDLFTMVITQMGSLVTFITANPIVLIFVVLGLVGLAVGMFKRLVG